MRIYFIPMCLYVDIVRKRNRYKIYTELLQRVKNLGSHILGTKNAVPYLFFLFILDNDEKKI